MEENIILDSEKRCLYCDKLYMQIVLSNFKGLWVCVASIQTMALQLYLHTTYTALIMSGPQSGGPTSGFTVVYRDRFVSAVSVDRGRLCRACECILEKTI